MKQTKFLAMIMAALVLGMNTSCGDDEEKVIKTELGTLYYKIIKDKDGNAVQVNEFSFLDDSYSTPAQHTCKYYYDQTGKLWKMTDQIGQSIFAPTSIDKNFKVSYKETDSEGITRDQYTEFKVDGEKDLTSYKVVEKATWANGFYRVEEDAKFTYDGAKQLKLVVIEGSKSEQNEGTSTSNKYKYTIAFTWADGNMTKGEVEINLNDAQTSGTINFSYNTYQKIESNQMPYMMVKYGVLGGYSQSQQLFCFLPLVGFGKAPQNVPSYINGNSVYASFNSKGVIQSENECTYKYETGN